MKWEGIKLHLSAEEKSKMGELRPKDVVSEKIKDSGNAVPSWAVFTIDADLANMEMVYNIFWSRKEDEMPGLLEHLEYALTNQVFPVNEITAS